MKRRTVLLLAILGLIIFNAVRHQQKPTFGQDNGGWYNDKPLVDLHIPDEVTTHASSIHLRIPATGLSMIVPDGFEQTIDLSGFKNKDTCIDVREDHTAGLTTKRKEADTYISYIGHNSYGHEYLAYQKDFKFNGYNAFIICLSDTTSTRASIYMAFGDDRFSVAMTGVTADNTEANRAKIIETMMTACYERYS